MKLVLIFMFALLGSVCSVGLAGTLLIIKRRRLKAIAATLIPYAIGTLLGAAFFGMIPHALVGVGSTSVLPTVLFGIILFYVLEKFALWRHSHEGSGETHSQAGTMILIGDALHNFTDGVAIAVSFAGSVPLGVAASVAVIVHEVPQEVGDFVILMESGYSRRRALLLNTLSGLTTLPGAALTFLLLPAVQSIAPYLLSVSAASFIYIALADLVPGRRITGSLRSITWELPLIGLGVCTIVAVGATTGH